MAAILDSKSTNLERSVEGDIFAYGQLHALPMWRICLLFIHFWAADTVDYGVPVEFHL